MRSDSSGPAPGPSGVRACGGQPARCWSRRDPKSPDGLRARRQAHKSLTLPARTRPGRPPRNQEAQDRLL